jgi:hypothetical protein
VHLEGAHRGYKHHSVRCEARVSALDVTELLGADVCITWDGRDQTKWVCMDEERGENGVYIGQEREGETARVTETETPPLPRTSTEARLGHTIAVGSNQLDCQLVRDDAVGLESERVQA